MINNSYVFPEFLSLLQCDSIINECLSESTLEDAMVNVNGKYEVLEKARKSKVSFFPYEGKFDWLLDKIKDKMNSTIQLKGFDINYEANFQFTHYGQGEYYGWHQDDSDSGPASNRAFSIVIQLSDNYNGGLLQYKENGIKTFTPGVGNMFLFPSFWSHQVTPVTEGIRYSLVSWFSLQQKKNYKHTLL